MKKIISLFLSFLMVAALLPYNVWAMELREENETEEEEIHECEIEGEHIHEEEFQHEESVSEEDGELSEEQESVSEEILEEETVQPEEPLEEETITEEISNEAETLGAASVVASGDCGASGGNLKWTLDSNGTLTISGSGAMKDFTITINKGSYSPWWSYNSSIKSLVIESGVTTIGSGAFKDCAELSGNLVIPDSVTRIGTKSFYNTGFTGSLTIGNKVKTIEGYAFYNSEFTGKLKIPNSVQSIGQYAFYSCNGFSGVTIGTDVKTIGRYAFAFCKGFTGNLVIPDSVMELGEYAFEECSGFTGNLTIGKGLTVIERNTFKNCLGFRGNLVIPDNVTEIATNAFYECSGFDGNLVLSNNLTRIGWYAFKNCSAFTGSLTIPTSVKEIENWVFYGCGIDTFLFEGDAPKVCSTTADYPTFQSKYDVIYYPANNSTWVVVDGKWKGYNAEPIINGYCGAESGGKNLEWTLVDGVLTISGKGEMKDFAYSSSSGTIAPWRKYSDKLEKLVIESGVTSIGDYAFVGCSGFTGNLVIPKTIKEIGSLAFENCSGFTGDIIIPSGVTSLSGTFRGCKGFNGKVVIPDSVTEIGNYTFYYCKGLNGKINISENVKAIESYAFYDCGINEYAFSSDAPTVNPISSYASFDKDADTIYYPKGNPTWEIVDGKWNGFKAEEWVPCPGSESKQHSFGAWSDFIAATCSATGEERKYCANCDYYESRVSEAKGHSLGNWYAFKAATCTQKGEDRKYCENCNYYESRTTEIISHVIGDWYDFKAATCTEPGEERKYCENCDYYESRATEATGHSYTQKIVAPTCTEQGYTLNECHCGESYKNKFVAGTGHSGGTATCVEQKTCKVCGEKYGKFDLENHGNNGTTIENTKEATCCEIGYTGDKICNDCKLVIEKGKEIAINSDNHANYGTEEDKNSAIAPDCKNSGKKANIICSGCKEIVKIGDTIPATGNHKGGTATCSEQKTCENCGDKYGELDPKNHGNNGTTLVNVKEATCREKGYTGDKVCKGCEVVVEKGESTAINPNNHGDYGTEEAENSAVEPDCKNAGKKADMLCSGCKAVVKIGDVIPATGNHIGGTATCTEKAICSECGDKYGNTDSNNHGEHSITVEDVKDATCVEKGYTGNKVCSGCKGIVEKGSDTEATGHDFDEWYVTVEPTFSDKGEDRRDCKKCDYFETRATAKTDDGKTDVIITISSGKIINKKNEKISVTAEMTQGVKEIQFTLKYDPKVIKLVSCQKGDNFKNATLGVGTSGNVYFTWKSDEEIFEADLFEIEFAQIDGTAAKTTEITIDSENGFAFLDKYGEKVSSEIVAGTVDFVEVDYGDVNNDGKVTVMDVFLTRLLAAKLIHLDELQELSVDVDGDGAISAVDANIIRKYAVKIITVFPAEGTHVHNYYRKNVTVAPTCTLQGTQTAYCACGKFITESVSPLGHDYVGVVKEEANCIKKGTKTYTCSRCNDSYNELIPVNNNHNYSGKVTKEATCGSEGVMTYTCSLCKKSYTEEIAATGKHNYTAKVTKAATCTESGIKTCTCSVCKDSFTETISATGHSWNSATCTEPSICKNCGITSGEKLGHSYSGKITKAATCGAKGVKTFTCSVCKDSYTEEIAATGNHNHIPRVTKAATCGTVGEKTFTCSVCKDSYTEVIPATNAHNYSTRTTKNPTCTAEGIKTSTCSVCKYSYEETIPANGHNWSDATCTEAKTCRTCGVTSGSALGHNYVGLTCITPGKCSRCGEVKEAGEEHNYKYKVIDKPSCKNSGTGKYTCSMCGYSYTIYLAATAHDYEDHICSFCGKLDPTFWLTKGQLLEAQNDLNEAAKLIEQAFSDLDDASYTYNNAYSYLKDAQTGAKRARKYIEEVCLLLIREDFNIKETLSGKTIDLEDSLYNADYHFGQAESKYVGKGQDGIYYRSVWGDIRAEIAAGNVLLKDAQKVISWLLRNYYYI